MNRVDFHISDYLRITIPDLCRQRPQLVDVADKVEEWLLNGSTGDVFNISMPTRFGKSLLATAVSVWSLVCNPNIRILRASYSAELAETFSVAVRSQYLQFCEMIGLESSINGTRSRWSIGERVEPSHAAVGVGGSITGFGFDFAIVDDTSKNMLEATSAAHSRQLEVFKDSVLIGRLEGQRKILNVGTRWTVYDWFSLWSDAEEYVLPAMVDGHSVCEAWKTTEELNIEKERISDEIWNAQYQQRPTATGRIRLFEGWRPEVAQEIPAASRVVVIDPATDFGSDFFVCGEYIYSGGFIYLCEMFAEQAATVEQVAAWLRGREYKVAWIECNGSGANIMDKLRRLGVKHMSGFTTIADKYSRAYLQAEAIKNYFRVSPSCTPEAVQELTRQADAFPVSGDNIHDDLLDNVIMAFERLYKI